MVSPITPKQDDRELHILFVGTPPIHLQAVCAESCARSVDIDIVTDGRAAIRRLAAASEPSGDYTRPDLVLLQCGFELPDGMTVLHAIKSSPQLNTVPVVVLKANDGDIETIYETGGNAYVRTPHTSEEYVDLISSIGKFWFKWVQYPAVSLYSDR